MATIPFSADLTVMTRFWPLAELLGDYREFECMCEAEVSDSLDFANVIVTAVIVGGSFNLTKSLHPLVKEFAREIAAQAENTDEFCRSVRLAEGVVYRGRGYNDPDGRMVREPDPDRQREERDERRLMEA